MCPLPSLSNVPSDSKPHVRTDALRTPCKDQVKIAPFWLSKRIQSLINLTPTLFAFIQKINLPRNIFFSVYLLAYSCIAADALEKERQTLLSSAFYLLGHENVSISSLTQDLQRLLSSLRPSKNTLSTFFLFGSDNLIRQRMYL